MPFVHALQSVWNAFYQRLCCTDFFQLSMHFSLSPVPSKGDTREPWQRSTLNGLPHYANFTDVLLFGIQWNLYQIVMHFIIHFNCIHVTFGHEIYQTSSTIWNPNNKKPQKGKDLWKSKRKTSIKSDLWTMIYCSIIFARHIMCLQIFVHFSLSSSQHHACTILLRGVWSVETWSKFPELPSVSKG